MNEINSKYIAKNVENKWYSYWLENKYFSSKPNDKKPYTIVIPPPNVTGVLHMGHMLNNTIQDVLIRKARMSGYNACWVPGTDHASIATEAKVVNKLKNEGISKFEIGREKFLEHAWEWTHKHGGIILEQLKKLGCSCDWDRTKFTMDEDLSKSVIKIFIELYNKGLIYRGYRMINWDPEAKTNISDEEVIYKEQQGKLYFLKYYIENSNEFVVIATTRPETIFGDTAVCFHPEDERYLHLKGKNLIIPIVNRTIPIIYDDYIDREFGTGSLKVTPANDINDYNLGKKHHLETIEIFNDDATLNEKGMHYQGLDRFVVRKQISKELEEKSLMEKVDDYQNKIGTSERTGAIIEPKLSVQWYLKMKDLASPALKVVMEDELKFFPNYYKSTFKYWMENITDWNISRQLWWGHQIPAYFYGNGENDFVVAQNIEDALILAQQKSSNLLLKLSDLKQDSDCLDTWFSSWLWPISVFNGVLEPENEEINYYYPTNDLVTGPDIIFFWVARMIMAGYDLRNEKPFKNVYFTGIVRDKLGRKMSKQLGNSPDPIELIEKYGADGIRMGILMSSSAGNDLKFDFDVVDENDNVLTEREIKIYLAEEKQIYYKSKLAEQGRNFATKIWNAFRLIHGFETKDFEQSKLEIETISWIENRINEVIIEIEDCFSKYRISEALLAIYKLIWDDFCSWYLEAIKPEFGKPISKITFNKTIEILENVLKILHPFMPFISEEIWHQIKERKIEEAIIISDYPTSKPIDEEVIKNFETAKEIISIVRNYRQKNTISPKEKIILHCSDSFLQNESLILKLANLECINFNSKVEGYSFIITNIEFSIPLNKAEISSENEAKIEQEMAYLEGFLKSVNSKLSNEKFVSNAKPEIVAMELKKKSDAEDKLAILKAQKSK